MSFSRGQLRKLPILAEIHELLKRENEAGSITRQEAVSMVPPLFLGVEPHHRVNLTASTGSCLLQQHPDFEVLCSAQVMGLPADPRHVCRTRFQDSTDPGDVACWHNDAFRWGSLP